MGGSAARAVAVWFRAANVRRVTTAVAGEDGVPAAPCGTGRPAGRAHRDMGPGYSWARVSAQYANVRRAFDLYFSDPRHIDFDWVARCRFDVPLNPPPPPAWAFFSCSSRRGAWSMRRTQVGGRA